MAESNSEKLIRVGQSYLLGPNGKERVSYLLNKRSLHLDTIQQRRFGWLPEKGHMPSKLLIPFYNSEDNLIRISKGSNPDSPYPIGVSSAKPLMVLESKLDTILIAQEAGEHIGVLGMGTTEMKFNPTMIRYLSDNIPIILISLDNDQSGKEKTTALLSKFPNAIDWPVLEKYGKDPGDACKRINLKQWV